MCANTTHELLYAVSAYTLLNRWYVDRLNIGIDHQRMHE